MKQNTTKNEQISTEAISQKEPTYPILETLKIGDSLTICKQYYKYKVHVMLDTSGEYLYLVDFEDSKSYRNAVIDGLLRQSKSLERLSGILVKHGDGIADLQCQYTFKSLTNLTKFHKILTSLF